MLGIITALTAEAACFQKNRPCPPRQIIKLEDGSLLYISGIGKQNATQAALELIAHGAKALLSWGTAGAIFSQLMPGDIIIPTHCVTQHHLFTMTTSWQQQLCNHMQTPASGMIYQGPLLHTDTTISHHQQKQELYQQSGALAIDMETVAIAAIAEKHQISMACVRVIVDPAHFTLPRLATCAINEDGQLQWSAVIHNLLRYPQDWRTIMQLAQYFKRAKSSLRALAPAVMRAYREEEQSIQHVVTSEALVS